MAVAIILIKNAYQITSPVVKDMSIIWSPSPKKSFENNSVIIINNAPPIRPLYGAQIFNLFANFSVCFSVSIKITDVSPKNSPAKITIRKNT